MVLVGVNLHRMKLDVTPVWYQEVDLVGIYAHGAEDHDGRRQHTYDVVHQLLADGAIDTEGLVTHRFGLPRWRDTTDLSEVVGDAGLLVPPENHKALAAAMIKLLDNPDQANVLGRAGYERVQKKYTWLRAAEKTVAAYREVIRDHR